MSGGFQSSTAANYGGRVQDNQQGIKQFIVSSSGTVNWILKKINGLTVITPQSNKPPVLINNDLIVTGSIFNTSDRRLKNNIETINESITEDLFTINPIIFSYKNDITNKPHYGVLAQDVEKVFPELVENNYISGYKTVNYQELIPLMLAKMKYMQNEINELKNKNL
jgi:hypothetical protein